MIAMAMPDDLLPKIPEDFAPVKEICLAARLCYPGGSANPNLAYPALKKLLADGLIEKRKGNLHHPNYTEYRRIVRVSDNGSA